MFSDAIAAKYQNKESIDKYTQKINTILEKTNKKFEDYQNKMDESLTRIDKTNISNESIKNIDLLHKILSICTKEKLLLHDYKNQKEKIEGELFDFYRNHSDISSKLRSESSISKYVYSHSTYQIINKLVKTQMTLVEYLDGVIVVIRDRGFTIKNIIEMIKIELGM